MNGAEGLEKYEVPDPSQEWKKECYQGSIMLEKLT